MRGREATGCTGCTVYHGVLSLLSNAILLDTYCRITDHKIILESWRIMFETIGMDRSTLMCMFVCLRMCSMAFVLMILQHHVRPQRFVVWEPIACKFALTRFSLEGGSK